ncbi:hypothetical protein HU200_031747 [Digitaria exilis]|uniref:Thaumatin-like protein n=1 Tax=Digitaria exilis TaxID=1010633 RepID=A0A835BQA2_9POAL|nr:hypothetical protein HU200_031747 [Digitaria exilis]
MATRAVCRALVSFLVILTVSAEGSWPSNSGDFDPPPKADTLNIKNPKPGSQPLSFTPVELKAYEYTLGIPLPHGWSGRIWGRTDCSTDAGGNFTCATGDCGSGNLEYQSGEPSPAATVAEFALGKNGGGADAYGVSLADGYNLPLLVTPYYTNQTGGGRCAPATCAVDDLDGACPPDQQVKVSGRVVGCKAGSSVSLQKACPEAKGSGSFSCAVVDNTYTVTFCP